MPTVGLRRTTREFGLKKSVQAARVLRSGRHLWPESADKKQRKGGDREECYNFVQSKGSGKQIGWTKNVSSKRETDVAEVGSSEDHVMAEVKPEAEADVDAPIIGVNGKVEVDKMYGIVYSRRKRKASDTRVLEEKMYGIHFTRRQKRKTATPEVLEGFKGLALVANSAPASDKSALSTFLLSIWRYMKRVGLGLSDLSGFLSAEPISSVYAKNGIHFLWDPPSISGAGFCKFFETRQSSPMFVVNFCAIPNCFFLLHVNMLLRHRSLSLAPVNNSNDEQLYGEEMYGSGDDDDRSLFPSENDMAEAEAEAVEDRVVQQQQQQQQQQQRRSHRLPKQDGRTAQHRYGVRSRSIRKRRSALRSRRSWNPLVLVLNKKNGALASDLVTAKRSGCPFSSVVSQNKVRESVRRREAKTNHDIAPTTLGNQDDTDSSACAVNLLVIETDRCYKEEGAKIVLESCASGEWVLAVKRDGVTRYTQKPLEVMRPYVPNRITRCPVWVGDNGWKLEFPNRDNWLKFKDLNKECCDRNKQAALLPAAATAVAKIIPVPRVTEVSDYEDLNFASFSRLDTYITVSSDEVARAMAKTTANYDIDSEDEDWLSKFNHEQLTESELVTVEAFELMIDAFEKVFYYNPHDFTDEKPDADICSDICKREVVEAVYSHWMKKRKQRRSALIRVFQAHQPKRAPLVPKAPLRKKRSFKRQPSQNQQGRGKQQSVLQALEEQDSIRRLEEAKTNAKKALEAAMEKRQRAQFLMGNADLASYRALMALRIAEATEIVESPDQLISEFLDLKQQSPSEEERVVRELESEQQQTGEICDMVIAD